MLHSLERLEHVAWQHTLTKHVLEGVTVDNHNVNLLDALRVSRNIVFLFYYYYYDYLLERELITFHFI